MALEFIKCKGCGKPQRSGRTICSSCGANVLTGKIASVKKDGLEQFPSTGAPETEPRVGLQKRGGMRTKRIKIGATAVLVVAVAGWFYYTPYLAVKNMRAAAENKDSAALSRYVNFPSVRESLKASLNAKMLSEMTKKQEGNPFAALGAAFAMALVGPMVEAMVTPEALAMMMKGEKPSREKSKSTVAPDSATSGPETETSMGYENFNQFVVSTRKKGTADDPVALVFQREGLFSWKLSAIRLSL
jgi:hypothetical protein